MPMQVLLFHCLLLLSAKQFTTQNWKGTWIATMLLPYLKLIFGQVLASFGWFFGHIRLSGNPGNLFSSDLNYIFLQWGTNEQPWRHIFGHYLAFFLALFGHFWPFLAIFGHFFWFIRFSGNSANAFSSDLNSICRNEVQTSRFEDAKRGR